MGSSKFRQYSKYKCEIWALDTNAQRAGVLPRLSQQAFLREINHHSTFTSVQSPGGGGYSHCGLTGGSSRFEGFAKWLPNGAICQPNTTNWRYS